MTSALLTFLLVFAAAAVDRDPPAAGAATHASCVKMFNFVNTDLYIRFDESNMELGPAAYPALHRIVEFARDCPAFALIISGHSDSSGYEPSNVELSRRRAQTVADYIAGHGIDRARLRVIAKGSSEPIGDDATRIGRQKNRRIEFAIAILESGS